MFAVFSKDATQGTLSSPGDWTDIYEDAIVAVRTLFSYKIAGASESGPYTFSSDDSDTMAVGIVSYSGVDPNDPIVCTTTNVGNDEYPMCLACTTDVTNTVVIRAMGADDVDYTAGSNYPSAHTGRFTVPSTDNNNNIHCALADVTQAGIGTTGDANFTMTAGEQWVTLTAALKPAVTGGADGAVYFSVNNNVLTAFICA